MGWGIRGVSLGCRVLAAVAVVGVMAGCGSATQAASTAPVTAVSTGPTPRSASASPTAAPGSASGSGLSSGPSGVAVATATVPADVPLIGHNMAVGEKPPLEPAAALAHTQDGAIAFGKFWVQTLDWGYATTSTAYARHYVDPVCDNCSSLLGQIDAVAAQRQYYLGDRITVVSASVASTPPQNGAEYTVVAVTAVTGAQIVDSAGRFVDGAAAIPSRPLSVLPRWTDHGWSVVEMGGA